MMPQNEFEWIEWLEKSRKNDLDFIINELKSWVLWALSEKNFVLAQRIENLRIITSEKNLSVPMTTDVIILILKNGFSDNFEVFV